MAYRLDPAHGLDGELRRVAREQAQKAIEHLAGSEIREGVHEARKCLKKIRALLRLFRPHLGNHYKSENKRFRDAGRLLAPIRDATSLIEALERLEKQSRSSFDPVGAVLARRRDELEGEPHSNWLLKAARRRMQNALEEIPAWPLEVADNGFPSGLERAYRRGREALRQARKRSSAEHLHELRKRVKYHRYHCRLLVAAWKGPLSTREEEAHTLSDLLGEHHDLSELNRLLLENPAAFGGPEPVEKILRRSGARCAELAFRALGIGAKLYAEKPQHASRRMRRYWEVVSLGSPDRPRSS